ncbi:hypothetical protein CVS37_15230 [Burkholderia lata]|nr:hypothetical protein CVS37_15230 [Burkholderia lata]
MPALSPRFFRLIAYNRGGRMSARRSAAMKARWWLSVLLAALLGASAVAHACDSYGSSGSQPGSGDATQGKSGYGY